MLTLEQQISAPYWAGQIHVLANRLSSDQWQEAAAHPTLIPAYRQIMEAIAELRRLLEALEQTPAWRGDLPTAAPEEQPPPGR